VGTQLSGMEEAHAAFEKMTSAPSTEDHDSSDSPESSKKRLTTLGFQRKILPWATLEFEEEETNRAIASLRRKKQTLIVVASLIDKVPNLAGLARTGEIFQIEELVVPSRKIERDPVFQQIAVSAEKWLPLSEVIEEDLPGFLLDKKREGYTLLGVEQTSHSISLGKFEFPKKCLLLMGKEREGIPVELIHLLDFCIEIPQLGVTRSLNVHVSASLVVWEYTRQQQFTNFQK